MDLKLTDRQREVLAAYIEAGTTRQTAEVLGLSDQTVKNTLAAIRRKAGTRNTLQAVYRILVGE